MRHHAKVRERQFEEMLVAADGVKGEVAQLRDRLSTYDALVVRARGLDRGGTTVFRRPLDATVARSDRRSARVVARFESSPPER